MKNENPSPKKKSLYGELFFLILGGFIVYFGINEELNHVSNISRNSKGLMTVQTGAYGALLGLLAIIASICSIYAKIKNKSNQ